MGEFIALIDRWHRVSINPPDTDMASTPADIFDEVKDFIDQSIRDHVKKVVERIDTFSWESKPKELDRIRSEYKSRRKVKMGFDEKHLGDHHECRVEIDSLKSELAETRKWLERAVSTFEFLDAKTSLRVDIKAFLSRTAGKGG